MIKTNPLFLRKFHRQRPHPPSLSPMSSNGIASGEHDATVILRVKLRESVPLPSSVIGPSQKNVLIDHDKLLAALEGNPDQLYVVIRTATGTEAKHQASHKEDLPYIELVRPLNPQINPKPRCCVG